MSEITTEFSIAPEEFTTSDEDPVLNSGITVDKPKNLFLAGTQTGTTESGVEVYEYSPKYGDKARINYKDENGSYIAYKTRLHYLFTFQHNQVTSSGAKVKLTRDVETHNDKYEDLNFEYASNSSKISRPYMKLSNVNYNYKTSGSEDKSNSYYLKNSDDNVRDVETDDFTSTLTVYTFIYDQENKKIVETQPSSISLTYNSITTPYNTLSSLTPDGSVDVIIQKKGYENFKATLTLPALSEYISNDVYYVVLNKAIDVSVSTNLSDDNTEIILTSTGFTQENNTITVSDNSLVQCVVKHGESETHTSSSQIKTTSTSDFTYSFNVDLGAKLTVNVVPEGATVTFDTSDLTDVIVNSSNSITTFQNTTIPYTCTYNDRSNTYEANLQSEDLTIDVQEPVKVTVNTTPSDATVYEVDEDIKTILEDKSKIIDYNGDLTYKVKRDNYMDYTNTISFLKEDFVDSVSLSENYINLNNESMIKDYPRGKYPTDLYKPTYRYWIGGNKCINYIPDIGFYCYPLYAQSYQTKNDNGELTKDMSIPDYLTDETYTDVNKNYYYSADGITWEEKNDFPASTYKGLTDWGTIDSKIFEIIIPYLSADNTSTKKYTSSIYVHTHETDSEDDFWTTLSVPKGCYDYIKIYSDTNNNRVFVLLGYRDIGSTKNFHYILYNLTYTSNTPVLFKIYDYSFKNTYGAPILGCNFEYNSEKDNYNLDMFYIVNNTAKSSLSESHTLNSINVEGFTTSSSSPTITTSIFTENTNNKEFINYLYSFQSKYYNGTSAELQIVNKNNKYYIGPFELDKISADCTVNKTLKIINNNPFSTWNYQQFFDTKYYIASSYGVYSKNYEECVYVKPSSITKIPLRNNNNDNFIFYLDIVRDDSVYGYKIMLYKMSPYEIETTD